MKKSVTFLVGIIVLFMFAGVCLAEEAPAQETASAAAPLEELEYSFGEVKTISSSELVLTEYDYLTDQEGDVTYSVDPAVKLENAVSVAEIKAGDSIEIDYQVQGDKKIVKNIILEKFDDELAGEEGLGADDLGADTATEAQPAIGVDDVAK